MKRFLRLFGRSHRLVVKDWEIEGQTVMVTSPSVGNKETEAMITSTDSGHEQGCQDVPVINRSTLPNSDSICSDNDDMEETILRRKESISSLFGAIKSLDADEVVKVLAKMPVHQFDSLRYAGQAPLHAACFSKNVRILLSIINKEKNINVINSLGQTALHVAACASWLEGVKILLSNGACPDEMTRNSRHVKGIFAETPFHCAVRRGDSQTVCEMLHFTPDLHLTDNFKNTILHMAAQSNDVNTLKLLLQYNECVAQINDLNDIGSSPLHCIMSNDSSTQNENDMVKCAEILLDIGADVKTVNVMGETALFLAAKNHLPRLVKLLLDHDSDPTVKNREGRSTLHAACEAGCAACLKHLLDTNRLKDLMTHEDEFGKTPFHIAVDHYALECCELLLVHGEHLTNIDTNGRTRCWYALQNMPSSPDLLLRVFDSAITTSSQYTFESDFKITFDYSVILSESAPSVQTSLMSELNTSKLESLLKHPLMESFLFLKWNRIKPFFYFNVFMYFLFLILHTFYVIQAFGHKTHSESLLFPYRGLHLTLFILILMFEIFLIIGNFKKYLRHWESYFKIIALTTSAFIVFANDTQIAMEREALQDIAAISSFFAWIEFMMLLGRFPSLGAYILMFSRVAKSIIKFLVAFSSLLIAFTCSFYLLFQEISVFSSFWLTFVKILMMMIGEIDYGDIFDSGLATLSATNFLRVGFLIIFLFLIPILMANLLIGLAVSDIPDLQRLGKIRRLSKQASYLVAYERLVVAFRKLQCFPSYIRRLFSNRCSIPEKVIICPNQKRKWKDLWKLPSETLNAAKSIGVMSDSGDPEFDDAASLESQFRRFQKTYFSRIRSVDTLLSDILNKVSGLPDAKLEDRFKRIELMIDQQNRFLTSILAQMRTSDT